MEAHLKMTKQQKLEARRELNAIIMDTCQSVMCQDEHDLSHDAYFELVSSKVQAAQKVLQSVSAVPTSRDSETRPSTKDFECQHDFLSGTQLVSGSLGDFSRNLFQQLCSMQEDLQKTESMLSEIELSCNNYDSVAMTCLWKHQRSLLENLKKSFDSDFISLLKTTMTVHFKMYEV